MTDVFFFLWHFSYCVDSKGLNEFCILTRQICHFKNFVQTIGLHYYYFFLSATLFPIVLTAKCKTNLILEKTNKINSQQYNTFCADYIFICYLSLSFSSGNLNLRFWKWDLYLARTVGSGRKLFCRQRVNKEWIYSGSVLVQMQNISSRGRD